MSKHEGKTLGLVLVLNALLSCPASARNGQPVSTLRSGASGVVAVTFSPDGTSLAAACSDQKILVWRLSTGTLRATLKGHYEYGTAVVYLDNTRLASAGVDQVVRVWDVITGKELATLKGHTVGVSCLAASPDGTLLASGGQDGSVFLWDASALREKGHRERPIRAEVPNGTGRSSASPCVISVAFVADGTVAIAHVDGEVVLWNFKAGLDASLQGAESHLTGVAASGDGKMLALAQRPAVQELAAGYQLTLVEVATRKQRLLLGQYGTGHTTLGFSPDGRRLACASLRSTRVAVWDLSSNQVTDAAVEHPRNVNAVAFSPDGRLLAIGGQDGRVKVWKVDELMKR